MVFTITESKEDMEMIIMLLNDYCYECRDIFVPSEEIKILVEQFEGQIKGQME